MIEQLTIYKSSDSRRSKLFFPDIILRQMNWNRSTPIRMKALIDGFGVQVHINMVDKRKSIYFLFRDYYCAAYLSVPENIGIITAMPTICGYIVSSQTYPPKINIIFPTWLKPLPRNIKMTNSHNSIINTP